MLHGNIGVDIDGPLAKFIEKYRKFCINNYGDFKIGYIDELRLGAFFNSDDFDEIEVEEGSIDGIEKLSRHYELHIISGRTFYMREKTEKWIKRHFWGKFKSLNFINLNRNGSKYDVCKRLDCGILIEDEKYFLNGIKSDVLVIFYRTPYNIDVEPNPNIKIVNSWKEITDLLIKQKV
ncbi:MAG: hypothetical protein AB1571_01380 [Nanoarchaeota archaeon]